MSKKKKKFAQRFFGGNQWKTQDLKTQRGTPGFHLCKRGNELCVNGLIDQGEKVVNEEGGFRYLALGNTCID